MAKLGFYHEDWTFLGRLHFAAPSFSGRLAALLAIEPRLIYRPLTAPLWAGLYTLVGESAFGWHWTCLLVNILMAGAVFLLLRCYGGGLSHSSLWSLLFLIYPSKDATIFWTIIYPTSLSLCAILAAYLLHLNYVRTGKIGFLLLASLALLISFCAYDQCLFFPILFLLTPPAKEYSRLRAFRGTAVACAVAAAFLLFKFFIVGRLYSMPYEKNIVLSPAHFIYVYLAGLNANLGPQLLAACVRGIISCWHWAPAVAAACCLWPWIVRSDEREDSFKEACARPLTLLGIGIFFLGYLPIALSDYSPTPLNHGNRINLVPLLGLLFVASAAKPFRGRQGQGLPALRILTGLALMAHLGFAQQWVEGAKRAQRVHTVLSDQLVHWPRETTLFVLLPERYVFGKVPIFDAAGDISGAVRIWTGDNSRRADVVSPRMRYNALGVQVEDAPLIPYANLRLLDMPRGRIIAVDEQTFRRLPPPL